MKNTTINLSIVFTVFFLLCTGFIYSAESVQKNFDEMSEKTLAQDILLTTGVKGGLIVHLGCGEGKLTAALYANERYLVHGLDVQKENIEKARRYIKSLGLYGKVSVELFSGSRLPYTNNLVNLLVSENLGKVSMNEVMRILVPNGVAYIKQNGKWTKTVKPLPEEIDEWTHSLHSPNNNAVAHDSVVGPPHHLQWVGEPKWARSHDHLASISVVVSSGGRLFYIVDEGKTAAVVLEPKWSLVARDAFNGVILWKRPISDWEGHLRGFRTGPASLSRRLVAMNDKVYVTLGYGEPVSALDAATGKTIMTYKETDGAQEILYHDNMLFVVAGEREGKKTTSAIRKLNANPPVRNKRIIAIKADTGEVLWKKFDASTKEIMPTTLAVSNSRVFFQNTKEVVCLDEQNGNEIWRASRPISTNRWTWSTPTLVVYDNVVLSADRDVSAQVDKNYSGKSDKVHWVVSSRGGNAPAGKLIAFSVETGDRIWSCDCREIYNAPVDVLITDGLLWTGELVRARDPGITVARDPFTGEIKRERPPDSNFFHVGMGHHRCYRNKATNRYLILGRSGVEFIDVESGKGIANHWIRGVCQYGVLPCNGLLYTPSHSCACYIRAKLNGFNALAPKRKLESKKESSDIPRLERGPAYGKTTTSEKTEEYDWPTYRHDATRSGYTQYEVPTVLKQTWQTDLEGKLSSLVVASGMVIVSSIDIHTVYALDAETGKQLWKYTAGGRIDSPPTAYKGLIIFGSADGYVYCLRASDGELVWRFRAAPEDRRIVAYGRLESVWPVHGSVLVKEDVIYFTAGRSSFLDGGLYLYKLDPMTGKMLSKKCINSRDPETSEEPKEIVKGVSMQGALPDILSTDGKFIYLRHKRFDSNLVEQKSNVPHLYSPAGFLDDTWWHRTYWLFGTHMSSGWGGWPRVGNRVAAGRLLVLDDSTIYGFGRIDQYDTHGSHVGLIDVHYRLFSCAKEPEIVDISWPRRTMIERHWSESVELLARGMVLTDKTLFVAGIPDYLDGIELAYQFVQTEFGDSVQEKLTDALAAFQGKKGGVIYAFSTEDGKKLTEYKIESPPVWDGMVAANGRLYLSTADGKVLCMNNGN